jgi:hypothetical protein
MEEKSELLRSFVCHHRRENYVVNLGVIVFTDVDGWKDERLMQDAIIPIDLVGAGSSKSFHDLHDEDESKNIDMARWSRIFAFLVLSQLANFEQELQMLYGVAKDARQSRFSEGDKRLHFHASEVASL